MKMTKAQLVTKETLDRPELSLIAPCYNEQEVIRTTATQLIREFKLRDVDMELILVDNGSQDATGEIIDEMIAEGLPIVKERVVVNQGYGNGILQGLRVARGMNVGFICADGQVEARDVVRIYEILSLSKSPKLVKVRRRFRMDGLRRKIVSIVFNVGTTLMYGGLGSIDINGNPKILPREYLEKMNLQSKDWFIDAEVLIKAKELDLEVYEMNVFAQMRSGGRSNVRSTTIWEFIQNLIRYRFARPSSTVSPPQTSVEHGTALD